jgi:hypothetical protein
MPSIRQRISPFMPVKVTMVTVVGISVTIPAIPEHPTNAEIA